MVSVEEAPGRERVGFVNRERARRSRIPDERESQERRDSYPCVLLW